MLFCATSIENGHETEIFEQMTILDDGRADVRITTTTIKFISIMYIFSSKN